MKRCPVCTTPTYHPQDQMDATRLRWVNCEVCGGSGEIIRRDPNARDPSDEYAELCAACEGTGRDCQ